MVNKEYLKINLRRNQIPYIDVNEDTIETDCCAQCLKQYNYKELFLSNSLMKYNE